MRNEQGKPHVSFDFESIWDSGHWRKIGRREAATRFHRQIKTDEQWKEICAARDEYNNYCMVNKWYTPVLGSVWFGARKGWRLWLPDKERAEAIEDDPLPSYLQDVHTHRCSICEPAHDWKHEDPLCFINHDVICDEALAKRKARA